MGILTIINGAKTAITAQRCDAVGKMAECVLAASNPDAEFQYYAGAMLVNTAQETRRFTITALAMAFGADRAKLKAYLRSHSLCGPTD